MGGRRRSRSRSFCGGSVEDAALVNPEELRELGSDAFQRLHEAQSAVVKTVDQSTLDIASLRSVQDVYALFGLNQDDQTHRRDQVKMWTQIRDAMHAEIDVLTKSGKVENYDRAKRLHENLGTIRSGFEALQTEAVARNQTEQRANFEKARRKLQSRLVDAEERRLREEAGVEEKLREDLCHQQAIERENLAHERAFSLAPKQRWSKRILELQKAEAGLARLDRFDEAKNVRRMIDRLEMPEKRRHKLLVAQRLDREQQAFKDAQDQQTKRLHERLGERRWSALRRAQRDTAREYQRLKNLDFDMTHANVMVAHAKPELAIHPSELLKKRTNYARTSATQNGTRLLDSVLLKKEKEAVYVAPLCADHQFERPLPGTTPYDEGRH